MTKWDRFAGWPCRDNIADLHSTIGHNHPVNQEFDQVAPLREIQLLQRWRYPLAEGAQALRQCY